MSSLACLLKDFGYEVIGSDNDNYYFTEEKLKQKKIPYKPFGKNLLLSDYIYIIGNAYNETNEEVKVIKDLGYEYYYYHNFIGSKINKDLIAVSGTHGKTTTASFLVQFLKHDVSYIIGDGSGGGCNNSEYLVLEACEYKNHFLSYHPSILIVNNIELDHPDYFNNIDEVIASFQQLVNQSDFVLINGDDKNCLKLVGKKILKVGQNKNNDVIFRINKVDQTGYMVNLKYANNQYAFRVPFLGKHLVYDFVMAYVATIMIGKTPNLLNIKLPSRRMTEYKYGNTILIDDYAHHPTEIKALCESIRLKYPDYKINVIFQPHTYTRTLRLKKEFKKVLRLFDKVYIEKVFASERELKDMYKQAKINKIFNEFEKFNENVINEIDKNLNEVWIFLGAGEVNKYINQILKEK